MNSRLEGYKKEGKFDEGIVLIYKSLRDLIPALAETGSREWTELELLKKVLESSPELRNVSSLIMQGYRHYESTRFGDGGNESSFGSMMGIVNDISHINMVIRARAKRA